MNQYTQLLYYIKQLGESDGYINTIIRGNEIDLNKGDLYPIMNIVIDAGGFPSNGTVLFNVIIECVNIRDINKEVNTSKFWLNDNEVDNHNETLGALNRIWGLMSRDFAKNNITASENPTFDKIEGEKTDIVDGWSLSFDVLMPNTEINLCDGCN